MRVYSPIRVGSFTDPKAQKEMQKVNTYLRQLSTQTARLPATPQGSNVNFSTGGLSLNDYLYLPGRAGGQNAKQRVTFAAKVTASSGATQNPVQDGFGFRAFGPTNSQMDVNINIEEISLTATRVAVPSREWIFPAFNNNKNGASVGLHYFADLDDYQFFSKKFINAGCYVAFEDTTVPSGIFNAAWSKNLNIAWGGNYPTGGFNSFGTGDYGTPVATVPSLQIPSLDYGLPASGSLDRTHIWCMLHAAHTNTTPFEKGSFVGGGYSGRELYVMPTTSHGTFVVPTGGELPQYWPVVTKSDCKLNLTSPTIDIASGTAGIKVGMRIMPNAGSSSPGEASFGQDMLVTAVGATTVTMSANWNGSTTGANQTLNFFGPTWISLATLSASITEVDDSLFRIFNNADPTKKIVFDASNITGVGRTLRMPDVTGYAVLSAGAFTTANRILYVGTASGLVSDATTLSWDSANGRLGVGTITPQAHLHVGANTHTGAANYDAIVENRLLVGDQFQASVAFVSGRALDIRHSIGADIGITAVNIQPNLSNVSNISGAFNAVNVQPVGAPSGSSGSYTYNTMRIVSSSSIVPAGATCTDAIAFSFQATPVENPGIISNYTGGDFNLQGTNDPTVLTDTGASTNGTTTLTVTTTTGIIAGQWINPGTFTTIPVQTTVTSILTGTTLQMSNSATGTEGPKTCYFQRFATDIRAARIRISARFHATTNLVGIKFESPAGTAAMVKNVAYIWASSLIADTTQTTNWSFIKHSITASASTNIWALDFTSTNSSRHAGKLSLGKTTAPTAWLELGAGTTTVPPIVLTSGTNLTTAVSGGVEYNGSVFYLTHSDAVRTTVVTQRGTINAAGTSGAIGTTTLYTPPAAGYYVVHYTLACTTADVTAGTIQFQTSYTDDIGATNQTGAALILTATGRDRGSFEVYSASGVISYQTNLTGIAGTSLYALRVRLEYLG